MKSNCHIDLPLPPPLPLVAQHSPPFWAVFQTHLPPVILEKLGQGISERPQRCVDYSSVQRDENDDIGEKNKWREANLRPKAHNLAPEGAEESEDRGR